MIGSQSVGHSEVVALLDVIRDKITRVPELQRRQIEDATDCIETLTKVYMVPEVAFDWGRYRLTPTEMKFAEYLRSSFGKPRSKGQILEALYYDRPDDAPEIKIVDVYICKVRGKLTLYGCPYAIDTLWGRGYKMVDADKAETITPGRAASAANPRNLVLWDGFWLGRTQAKIAERLASPLGAVMPFPSYRPERIHFMGNVNALRRKIESKYIIFSQRGHGYTMFKRGAIEAVSA